MLATPTARQLRRVRRSQLRARKCASKASFAVSVRILPWRRLVSVAVLIIARSLVVMRLWRPSPARIAQFANRLAQFLARGSRVQRV